jgi:hypothetical protein
MKPRPLIFASSFHPRAQPSASAQPGGLGGPRCGGLPGHVVAFSRSSTQIEEDRHRVKQSRISYSATVTFLSGAYNYRALCWVLC